MTPSLKPTDITFTRQGQDEPYVATLPIDGRFAFIRVEMTEEALLVRSIVIGTQIPALARGCGHGLDHPDCVCGKLHAHLEKDPEEDVGAPGSVIGWGCPSFQMVLMPEYPQIYMIDCPGDEAHRRDIKDVPEVLNMAFQAVLSDGRSSLGSTIIRNLSEDFFTPDIRILFSTDGHLDAACQMPHEGTHYHAAGTTGAMLH